MPKRRVSPELVCVEPAQLPLEGVLAARGPSRRRHGELARRRRNLTSCDQLSSTQSGVYAHVMVVNFSHKEIQLSKATVLGLAEETSASV